MIETVLRFITIKVPFYPYNVFCILIGVIWALFSSIIHWEGITPRSGDKSGTHALYERSTRSIPNWLDGNPSQFWNTFSLNSQFGVILLKAFLYWLLYIVERDRLCGRVVRASKLYPSRRNAKQIKLFWKFCYYEFCSAWFINKSNVSERSFCCYLDWCNVASSPAGPASHRAPDGFLLILHSGIFWCFHFFSSSWKQN